LTEGEPFFPPPWIDLRPPTCHVPMRALFRLVPHCRRPPFYRIFVRPSPRPTSPAETFHLGQSAVAARINFGGLLFGAVPHQPLSLQGFFASLDTFYLTGRPPCPPPEAFSQPFFLVESARYFCPFLDFPPADLRPHLWLRDMVDVILTLFQVYPSLQSRSQHPSLPVFRLLFDHRPPESFCCTSRT